MLEGLAHYTQRCRYKYPTNYILLSQHYLLYNTSCLPNKINYELLNKLLILKSKCTGPNSYRESHSHSEKKEGSKLILLHLVEKQITTMITLADYYVIIILIIGLPFTALFHSRG